MSTERRRAVARLFGHRVPRRIVTISSTLIALGLVVVLSPVLLAGAIVIDLVRGDRRLRRTRVVVAVGAALIVETLGVLCSVAMWIATGFGHLGKPRNRWQRYRGFMALYTAALLKIASRYVGARIEWRDGADLTVGPVILVARHTSIFDAVIPNTLLSHRHRLLSHHVVTQGLRYSPCIDLVGHRLPNRFIRRSPGEGSAELGPITELGAVLDERSACVIFPEGTFRTPEHFERSVRRLRRRSAELADRAARLEHVLPPRASGTYALLAGAPDADIVMCTHTGFERFGSLRAILTAPVSSDPIIVETWRIPRSAIPDGEEAFGDWLFAQFVEIDRWVARQHEARVRR